MSAWDAQYDFTAPFEGAIPYMYLDTKGLVTCGVGFMLPDLAAARALPWQPSFDVDTDWTAVRSLPPGKPAWFYQRYVNARLPEAVMRSEFARRCGAYELSVAARVPGYYTLPAEARLAIMDMTYNLGPRFLDKWPGLAAALAARDWTAAAAQCHRRDIQDARNIATAALFQKCAT